MKDYKVNGMVVEITLDTGKVVKVATKWVEETMKALETDMEDVLLMWLEDNDYLVNEELEELDKQAKENKPKQNAKSSTERKKSTRERKPNPVKESIISGLADALHKLDATDIEIVNVGKIITFKVDGREFKLDLSEKRVKKV